MEFTSKAEYLEEVQEWIEKYHELSVNIRNVKLEIKNKSRSGKPIFSTTYRKLAEMKDSATEMLQIRADSKAEAQRQYLKSRE